MNRWAIYSRYREWLGEDEPESLTGPITAIEGYSVIRNKGGRADRGRSYLRFLITACHP